MIPQQFEIYSAEVRLGLCADARPCLVLFPPKADGVIVLPISSQGDLCLDPNIHFPLSPEHPDFKATGLKKKSYILAVREHVLKLPMFKRRCGLLTGELLAEFKKWYGL